MGTKPWQCLGAMCLGGMLLCGCQNEDKRPGLFGQGNTGVSKPIAGAPQPTFPTGTSTNTGIGNLNNQPNAWTPNNKQTGGWNPDTPGLNSAVKANSPATPTFGSQPSVPPSPFATGAGSNPSPLSQGGFAAPMTPAPATPGQFGIGGSPAPIGSSGPALPSTGPGIDIPPPLPRNP